MKDRIAETQKPAYIYHLRNTWLLVSCSLDLALARSRCNYYRRQLASAFVGTLAKPRAFAVTIAVSSSTIRRRHGTETPDAQQQVYEPEVSACHVYPSTFTVQSPTKFDQLDAARLEAGVSDIAPSNDAKSSTFEYKSSPKKSFDVSDKMQYTISVFQ